MQGDDLGKHVKVLDDAKSSGGFLILIGDGEAMKDGHDYWVEDLATLEGFFRQSGWIVEWDDAIGS